MTAEGERSKGGPSARQHLRREVEKVRGWWASLDSNGRRGVVVVAVGVLLVAGLGVATRQLVGGNSPVVSKADRRTAIATVESEWATCIEAAGESLAVESVEEGKFRNAGKGLVVTLKNGAQFFTQPARSYGSPRGEGGRLAGAAIYNDLAGELLDAGSAAGEDCG